MRVINANGKDYVLKFGAGVVSELNELGVTLMGLSQDMEELKVKNLYSTFFYGLKTMQHDMTQEKAYAIIDDLFEGGMDLEEFFKMVLEEYSASLGLGKKFKEIMAQQEEKQEVAPTPKKAN